MNAQTPPAPISDLQRAAFLRDMNNISLRQVGSILGVYMDDTLPMRLRCECGRPDCGVIINLTLRHRRDAHQHYPMGFVVVREHINNDSDIVQLNGANYVVVGKSA